MAYNVTTDWFDQQVKHGNYIAQEKDQTREEIEAIVREAVNNYDPLEHKNLDELDELEDEKDDFILQAYKEKRLNELKEFAKGAKYGSVREIRKQEYKAEITECNDVFIVLHLHQDHIELSRVLNQILINLAKKFPCVKFLRIEATNCVENFRDEDVPTVFLYRDGKIARQFLPAPFYFGGANMNWKKVEWILNSEGILKTELEEDPFEAQSEFKIKKKVKRDDESDSEEESKPSRWNI